MKILIVDDDPVSIRVLRQILERVPDCAVKEATAGFEAWMILNSFHDGFDAVFLDISLPDMDGIEFLRRIRAKSELRTLPVIFCTGSHDRDTVSKAAALGTGCRT